MTLQVYNTLTQHKQKFTPLCKGEVKMYLCGPTVYDHGHLGHARSAVSFDIIRRYLIYRGYKVTFVSNYTDIDDKMINRAHQEKISVKKLADKIIPEYVRDYGALFVLEADLKPKATEFIPEMITLIENLQRCGFTYELQDGIYFDIEKFLNYGKLSHQKIEQLRTGVRLEEDKNKKHPQDFVLWKKMKPQEPYWESPWGKGRPGWHIECSAMSAKLLGETFDIHGGGADLIFPHHEDEIAQSEAISGKPLARYWLHNGFIKVNDEKMSKSLGNFFTIRDILKKYSAKAVRYFLIATHYRAPINFTHEQLDQAENTLKRLQEFRRRIKNFNHTTNASKKQLTKLLKSTKAQFQSAMDDDFETPQALGIIFELINVVNQLIDDKKVTREELKQVEKLMLELDQVLQILPDLPEEEIEPSKQAWIEQKILERAQARQLKDWTTADHIRNELAEKGIELEDVEEKTFWKKIGKPRTGTKRVSQDTKPTRKISQN